MTTTLKLDLVNDASQFLHINDDKLIRRFRIKGKSGKLREVNDPIPELKSILKEWNEVITKHYMNLLHEHEVEHIPHAYLPNKSIQTNARQHLYSDVAQFDFKGFYDSCRFDYFVDALRELDPNLNQSNQHIVERLVIDPNTGGVTQGLPVSGALAGITLIPFWVELRKRVPNTITFTQYSDDLTFSYSGGVTPPEFTIPILTQKIYESLKAANRDFKLNDKKTRIQQRQYRKVTGIRINHHNQMTPSKKDYRFLRHALYILSKSDNLDKELDVWGFKSKEAFIGKVSYMRSIDTTGKVDKIIMQYRHTCEKHNIFTTWINSYYRQSAFA